MLLRERKPGRKAKWLFRKAKNFEERVVIAEGIKASIQLHHRGQSPAADVEQAGQGEEPDGLKDIGNRERESPD